MKMRALFTDQEYIERGAGIFIPFIFAHMWKDKMQVIGITDVFEKEILSDRQKSFYKTVDFMMSAKKYLEHTCRMCRNKGGSKKLTFLPWVSHCRESDINGLYRMDQVYNADDPFFASHPIIDPCGCNPLWNGIPQVCSMKVIHNLAPNFFNKPYNGDESGTNINGFSPLPSEINAPITPKQYRYIFDLEMKKNVTPRMKNLKDFTTSQASQYIKYLSGLQSGPSTIQSLMRRIDPDHVQTHYPLDDTEDLVTILEEAQKTDRFDIPTVNYI